MDLMVSQPYTDINAEIIPKHGFQALVVILSVYDARARVHCVSLYL